MVNPISSSTPGGPGIKYPDRKMLDDMGQDIARVSALKSNLDSPPIETEAAVKDLMGRFEKLENLMRDRGLSRGDQDHG